MARIGLLMLVGLLTGCAQSAGKPSAPALATEEPAVKEAQAQVEVQQLERALAAFRNHFALDRFPSQLTLAEKSAGVEGETQLMLTRMYPNRGFSDRWASQGIVWNDQDPGPSKLEPGETLVFLLAGPQRDGKPVGWARNPVDPVDLEGDGVIFFEFKLGAAEAPAGKQIPDLLGPDRPGLRADQCRQGRARFSSGETCHDLPKQLTERSGFTLIELLVVIAIIAVLASLIAAAVFRAMLIMPIKNTQLTILKLKSTLDQQWKSVYDAAWNESSPPAIWAQLLAQGGGDQNVARQLWIKQRLQEQFPATMNDINAPPTGQPVATYLTAIQGQGIPPEYVSSVCLYLALKQSRGIDFDPETMSPKEVMTVPGTTVKCFTDAWGKPLIFKNGLPTAQPTDMPKAVISSNGPDYVAGNSDDISSDKIKLGDY